MKIRNQARLCRAVSDFEPQIMCSICFELSHRKQTVHINNARSSLKPISCGVPQGSMLGTLLFSIYINDLPKASKFETGLYADDTALILRQ